MVAPESLKRIHVDIPLRKRGEKPCCFADPRSHVHDILIAKKHMLKVIESHQTMYLQRLPWATSRLQTLKTVPRFVVPMASCSVWSPNETPGTFVATRAHIFWARVRASGFAARGSGSAISPDFSGYTVPGNSNFASDAPPAIALRRELLQTGSCGVVGGALRSPSGVSTSNSAPRTRRQTLTSSFCTPPTNLGSVTSRLILMPAH